MKSIEKKKGWGSWFFVRKKGGLISVHRHSPSAPWRDQMLSTVHCSTQCASKKARVLKFRFWGDSDPIESICKRMLILFGRKTSRGLRGDLNFDTVMLGITLVHPVKTHKRISHHNLFWYYFYFQGAFVFFFTVFKNPPIHPRRTARGRWNNIEVRNTRKNFKTSRCTH